MHAFVVLAYKESEYLEECIKSVLNQTIKSDVLIATTTDNDFIRGLAKKYNLEVKVGKHTTIGGDFDFALNSSNSKLVTIAHQDDIYDDSYAENVVDNYKKYNDSLIIFSDYYEIRKENKEYSNLNLRIKRFLLFNLSIKKFSGLKTLKRNSLRFGNSICCPAVTFNKSKCPKEVFTCDLSCNVDWFAWEKLSKIKGKFVYIPKKLMGHRIDESTTTTDIIRQGIRTKEDLFMFKKFWPSSIATFINKFYSKSEKSNKID
ncbi:MAG: glycosyltransferase [Bacilli bacterium]|nr:glycosyltransferase [Bacilli bacterium]